MLKFMKNKTEFLRIGTNKSLEMGKINLSLASNSKIQKRDYDNILKGQWHFKVQSY